MRKASDVGVSSCRMSVWLWWTETTACWPPDWPTSAIQKAWWTIRTSTASGGRRDCVSSQVVCVASVFTCKCPLQSECWQEKGGASAGRAPESGHLPANRISPVGVLPPAVVGGLEKGGASAPQHHALPSRTCGETGEVKPLLSWRLRRQWAGLK